MGLQSHRLHHHRSTSLAATTALAFLLISLFSAQLCGAVRERRRIEGIKVRENGIETISRVLLSWGRLGGPGSSPPTCRSKCGRCYPCKPVHVPIQPGLSVPLEYYPEAWRCQCGNKLFMP